MAVITFSTRKGGAGKSTSALLLALDLSKTSTVIILDTDPNESLLDWARAEKGPETLGVVRGAHDEAIRSQITKARERADYVIVDVAGAANNTAFVAMCESDLVIIPSQQNYMAARQALRTLRVSQDARQRSGRDIPVYLLWTQTRHIKGRGNANIIASVEGLEHASVMRTELAYRHPFELVTEHGVALEDVPVSRKDSLNTAIANVQSFTDEVEGILRRAGKAVPQKLEPQKEIA